MRAWILTAGICVGIAAGGQSSVALLLVGTGSLVAARHRRSTRVALLLVGITSGALRAHQAVAPFTIVSELAASVQTCTVEGRVAQRSGSMGTFLETTSLVCDGVSYEAPSVIVSTAHPVERGSVMRYRARLSPLLDTSFDSTLHRMGAEARFEVLEREQLEAPGGPYRATSSIRRGVEESSGVLGRGEGSLMKGLVIGDTSGFSAEQESAYRKSGLSHLVAVSGSNIAMVAGAILIAASRFPHVMRYGLAATGVGLYVLVVGPDASVLRAAAMGAIGIAAALGGRRVESWGALGLAVGVALLVRPDLLYSVGLHLSAAATAGIILWARPIAAAVPGPRLVALAAGVTLSAQIAVTPILGATFGQVSLAALPANLLAAPAVAPATVLGLAAGCLAAVVPWAGTAVARMAGPALWWIERVAAHLGSPSWAEVTIPAAVTWVLGTGVLIAMMFSVRSHLRGVPG